MRNSIVTIVLGLLVFFLFFFALKNHSKKQTVQQIILPQRSIYLGAWVGGFWNNDTKSLDPIQMKKFEKEIGKKVAIANYYRGWDELDSPDVVSQLQTLNQNDWTPMVSANPYFSSKCDTSENENIYQKIANGECDTLIQNIANNFKAYKKPVFFRFAWEMNIDTIAWSIQSTYSTPPQYIHAWQHMHDIFTKTGAQNVKWVFAVNVEKSSSIPIASLYPGDMYVDWVGIDGYNWGNTQSWSKWESFDRIFGPTYIRLTQIAPNKPLMLSEFNSADSGGDKAAWLKDMLDGEIPLKYTKVDAIVFFNENKLSQENVDWTLEKSQKYVDTVKNALKNPMYKSSF